MKNMAVGALPPPDAGPSPRVTVNQNGTNWVGIIFAGFLCVVVGVLLFWRLLVYLMEVAGSRHPERDLAYALFWLILIALGVLTLTYICRMLLLEVLNYKRDIQTLHLETLRHQQLTAQQPAVNNRATDKTQRKLKLARLVMFEAYKFHARMKRNYKHNDIWPWAWRNCKGAMLYNEREPVTEDEARAIGPFLKENWVIVDNEINLAKFKDFAAFDAFLSRRYEYPIIVNHSSASQLDDGHYQFLE